MNSPTGIGMDKTMHAHAENDETSFRKSSCIDDGGHATHFNSSKGDKMNCLGFNLIGSTPDRLECQPGGINVGSNSPRPISSLHKVAQNSRSVLLLLNGVV